MKANEAPEKLYVELCSDGVYAHAREWANSDNIEYIRTDAFIEKICEFLKTNADKHIYFDECDNEWYDTEELIEDFKNYMKGE